VRRWLLSGCVLLLSLSVVADELQLRPGMTGVPDLGAIDCATFNHIYPAGPTGMEQAVLYWAEGWLYARSGLTMDELLSAQAPGSRAWDFDALTGHIVDFCAAHPDRPLPAAVADLWQLLDPAGD